MFAHKVILAATSPVPDSPFILKSDVKLKYLMEKLTFGVLESGQRGKASAINLQFAGPL